jgi:OOP family OmpA-OmpF porin
LLDSCRFTGCDALISGFSSKERHAVKITRWIGLSVLAVFAAGCGHAPHPGICAAAGALLGGGAGAGIAAARDGNNGDEIAGGAGIGAASGLVAGALLCYAIGYEPEREEVAPPPAPAPAPAPAPVKEKIVLRGVNFDFDKSNIRSDAQVILDEAASILGRNPDVAVSVEGHTDSVGTDAYNQKLSQRRAESVKSYLVGKGVSASRLSTQGFGEANPVASNSTKDGRALNRRVELKVAN